MFKGNGAVFQNFKNTGSLVNSSVTSNLTINKNKESKVTVEIGQLCEGIY